MKKLLIVLRRVHIKENPVREVRKIDDFRAGFFEKIEKLIFSCPEMFFEKRDQRFRYD